MSESSETLGGSNWDVEQLLAALLGAHPYARVGAHTHRPATQVTVV